MYIAMSALPKAQAEICIASETSLLIAPPERRDVPSTLFVDGTPCMHRFATGRFLTRPLHYKIASCWSINFHFP